MEKDNDELDYFLIMTLWSLTRSPSFIYKTTWTQESVNGTLMNDVKNNQYGPNEANIASFYDQNGMFGFN